MSLATDQFDELGRLTAALCDGEITPEEAARLEQLADESSRAREFFVRYLELHGELYWDNATGAGRDTPAEPESISPVPRSGGEPADGVELPLALKRRATSARLRVFSVATAASLVVAALVGVASHRGWLRGPQDLADLGPVASVTRTIEPNWADGRENLEGTQLRAGRKLDLRQGLAEIRFHSQARVILEGPATFVLDDPNGGFLHAGKLTAVVPHEAAGFTVRTPSATVVDWGTEFGVAVEPDGRTEVHVFAGTVGVRPKGSSPDRLPWRPVHAAEAVRTDVSPGSAVARIDPIEVDGSRFVRTLPVPGSVAGFRALVAGHPNLIHHYTFEGVTEEEKRRDKKGGLDLAEVVMHGGRGGGRLDYLARGLDATTNAVAPYRTRRDGNAAGVALQSEKTFKPPPALTVELLLNFEGVSGPAEGATSAAVATRADDRDCGFFVVAADRGCLVHLMDGDSPWTESGLEFSPGEWYYVACTFRAGKGKTTVSTYVANLSRGERELRQVVGDQDAVGLPAASRLGIGKGFAENIAHAYPWAGGLDEVAIYNAVLDRQTLEKHLRVLVSARESH